MHAHTHDITFAAVTPKTYTKYTYTHTSTHSSFLPGPDVKGAVVVFFGGR